MGMGLELNTMIVTKGKEERKEGNLFHLQKSGYRLFPMHIPIDVRKSKHSDPIGFGTIEKMEWKDGVTTIFYRLISLNRTN
ncbi:MULTISPECIES: DUF2584 domain-containing protein [Bacillaceae]|uniref:DUF2584 domain-containing protein n=1 Tax=Bacillaceae TaxID=186817 RepID=UPI001C589DC3|nr:DUF2584 domain-containing protein [Rossellomorea sp. YZS02]MBW3114815.1 DUF2584 domain-containing protein [Bacillus sp. MCCB 382]MDX8345328.1 DUF2584 domain-containing protein [Rossellomorea sp. YZS02]